MRLLATAKHGQISGIYHDACRLLRDHIATLGVVYENHVKIEAEEQLPPPLAVYRYPAIGGSPVGIFRSEASLNAVRSIRACYYDDCCTGLAVEYTDSSVEILGRWYESMGGRHELIYDVFRDKIFKGLRCWKSTAGRVVDVDVSHLSCLQDDTIMDAKKDLAYTDCHVSLLYHS